MSSPIALRVGPGRGACAGVEIELADGTVAYVDLSVHEASLLSERLRECIDGRVTARVTSRRVLEIPLGVPFSDDSSAAIPVVPSLDADLRRQGAY